MTNKQSSKDKNRKVSFSFDTKIVYIPRVTDEQVKMLYYSGEDVRRMKDAALLEDSGVTQDDLAVKGKDLFNVDKIGFRRASLERVAREVSPIRSPLSPRSKRQGRVPVDLGDSLFSPGVGDETTEGGKLREETSSSSSSTAPSRPTRERRAGDERGIRRAKSSAGPNRTDSLAARTHDGRALRNGAPRRARSSFSRGPPRGGLSELEQMQASARNLSSRQLES